MATKYPYEGAVKSLLERFEAPFHLTHDKKDGHGGENRVDIIAPEFTSLCPITGQPDFATIEISYVPDGWCVESKSLKLYLGSYRQQGMFHEACVDQIAHDLIELLQPAWIQVVGKFSPRGGISFWPTVIWEK